MRPKMAMVPKYYIELFDSLGMLNQAYFTDSSFSCSKKEKVTYSQESLVIFERLKTSEKEKALLDDFSYVDTIAESCISFDSKSKKLVVVRILAPSLNDYPMTYFLNDKFQVVKDSLSSDARWRGGCGEIVLVTNYHYDEKGKLLSKKKDKKVDVEIIYDAMNRETTHIYKNGGPIYFTYPSKSILKVNFSSSYVEPIEFEYY